MPGDYSRKLFNAKKHYSAVLEQQGRVQVDADWNEQVDIQQYRISTEATDVIGATGVPKENNGFGIIPFVDGSDFSILPGRIYVDGLLFELEPGTTSYRHQPYYSDPDIDDFDSSSQGSPPGSPVNASLNDGTYLVYFEGWQKEITFHDDPSIQEVALGEADTTTRLQNVWQVKLLKVASIASADCNTSFTEWDEITATPTGKLSAQVVTNTAEEKPCSLPPGSGFTGLENQLYRIQILKGGDKTEATFVWSRDNASVETNVIDTTTNSVTVTSIGKDDVLGFANGQWVEVLKDEQNLTGDELVQIDNIDPAQLKIAFKIIGGHDNGISAYSPQSVFKLRRWDVTGADMRNGIAMTDDWINIESGIQVKFDAGNYCAGDYWLIPARTATANIEWPFTSSQWPVGIKRHYSKLGIIIAKSGQLGFIDCRQKFPTLTSICAEDICFDNNNCDLPGATTVQDALDMLCMRSGGGSCTIVVSPGIGWESALDVLADGMDAQICFQVGDYPLSKPVVLKNKGNLKLAGCGPATRIISAEAESALVFDHCKAVTACDLYAEGGIVNPDQSILSDSLNGVFSFIGCTSVKINRISAKTGYSDTRNCTCITVNGDVAAPCSVRIEDCDLQVANKQQGILVINTSECWITKNSIKVYTTNAGGFTNTAGISFLLASNLQPGAIGTSPNTSGNNVVISSSDFTVNFKTDQSLKESWQAAMNTVYPTAATSLTQLQLRVKYLARNMARDSGLQNKFSNFAAYIKTVSVPVKAVASQGITVGGQVAKTVYIEDNVIADVLQGIHVGVSHRTTGIQPDTIADLSIRNNSMAIALPLTTGKEERYGIFVGNCTNLLIENNKLTLERLTDTKGTITIDGIRVWGSRGQRLVITQNLLMSTDGNPQNSFSMGINVQPSVAKPASALWIAMFNVVHARVTGISNTVTSQNNVIALTVG